MQSGSIGLQEGIVGGSGGARTGFLPRASFPPCSGLRVDQSAVNWRGRASLGISRAVLALRMLRLVPLISRGSCNRDGGLPFNLTERWLFPVANSHVV